MDINTLTAKKFELEAELLKLKAASGKMNDNEYAIFFTFRDLIKALESGQAEVHDFRGSHALRTTYPKDSEWVKKESSGFIFYSFIVDHKPNHPNGPRPSKG